MKTMLTKYELNSPQILMQCWQMEKLCSPIDDWNWWV